MADDNAPNQAAEALASTAEGLRALIPTELENLTRRDHWTQGKVHYLAAEKVVLKEAAANLNRIADELDADAARLRTLDDDGVVSAHFRPH